MGGCFSKQASPDLKKICFICREPINTQLLIRCAFCKMILHPDCEYDFSKEYGNETYCKCPHCMSIGTLVTRPNPLAEQINPLVLDESVVDRRSLSSEIRLRPKNVGGSRSESEGDRLEHGREQRERQCSEDPSLPV